MNWLFIALLAPAIYTVVNFIDKYIVEKHVKDSRGMPIYGTIMGLVMGMIFWVGTGFPTLGFRDTVLSLLTGALTIWGAALYFKAISNENASKIIILFQMTPVIILILSSIFLHDTINAQQFIGFILILAAALAVSSEGKKQKFKLSEAFWLILSVDFLWSITAILAKFTIEANSFQSVLAYESWGIGLGGILLYAGFPSIRKAFHKNLKTIKKRIIGVMFLNEGIFVIAKTLTFLAYSLGPTALVSVIGSSTVFYGILYGWILTLIAPKIFQEDVSKQGLIRKFALSIILLLGIILVN
jgi:drug/metabolite transporter (DMT)-like permease